MRRYSFAWVTGAFFLVTLAGHWAFGWYDYVGETTQHGASPETADYLIQMMRETLENWQSEFLQLVWQVAGLAMFYYAGSPQSRGDDERMEAKLDLLLRRTAPDEAEEIIRSLDGRFPGR